MKDVGRPTIVTDEVVAKLEMAFRDGSIISEACRIANISRDAYYDRLKKDAVFSDKMSEAQEYPDNIAKLVVVNAIKNKDVDTAKWWVERKIPDFNPKNKTDITSGGKPLPLLGGQTVISNNDGDEETPKTP